MGDPERPKPTMLSLPPGCRFYPSEEQLVCYYLTHKNNDDRRFEFDVIDEIDLYGCDPFDLPETACFRYGRGGRRRHWYCYVPAKFANESGRRRAGGGYWRRRGRARDVIGGAAGKAVAGTRKTFAFYLGDSSKRAVRTDLLMYEYALIDHEAAFILCRVFVKPCNHNNVSDHVVSSCWEGSSAAVRHIGIQHDGTSSSGVGVAMAHDDNSVDSKNEGCAFRIGIVSDLDAGAVTTGIQGPLSVRLNGRVRESELINGSSRFIHGLADHHMMAILEGDFIELDDLASPLPSFDFT